MTSLRGVRPCWFADIAKQLRTALDTTFGSGHKFDLLGFDACLMGSLFALSMYQDVTRYYVASQATEPAKGWNYAALTATTSLSLGKHFRFARVFSRR